MFEEENLNLFGERGTDKNTFSRGCPMCRGKVISVLGGWVCDTCDFRATDKAKARRADPVTSHEAADSIAPEKMRNSQREVLDLFERHGEMTDLDMLGFAETHGVKQSPSGLRTRRHELAEKGLIRASGRYQVYNRRRHIIWELVV